MNNTPLPAAFPTPIIHGDTGQMLVCVHGMTLRDYFAAAALQGFLSGNGKEIMQTAAESPSNAARIISGMVEVSFGFADAMLKAREQ